MRTVGSLLLAILAFAMVIAVIKMVIVAIVVAGLIFRTKITVGLLAIGGVLTFTAAFPWIALPLLATGAVVAVVRFVRRDRAVALLEDPEQE